jgi:hypothetical protein
LSEETEEAGATLNRVPLVRAARQLPLNKADPRQHYPRKPPPRPLAGVSAVGQELPNALQKSRESLAFRRRGGIDFGTAYGAGAVTGHAGDRVAQRPTAGNDGTLLPAFKQGLAEPVTSWAAT